MLPSSSNSGQAGAGDVGAQDPADESFLASVASIWDAEISDLTTAEASLADDALSLDTALDAEAVALTLPTPDSDTPEVTSALSTAHHDATPASAMISMSTTFTSGAMHGGVPPDVVLVSTDDVYFYVNRALLATASANYFAALLPPAGRSPDGFPLAQTQDTSDVLNIVLHAVYDISPARYAPPVTTLLAALDRLPEYGMLPAQHVVRPRALYAVLLAQAPLAPLAVYTAAARYGLNDLAVAVSSHLLSFPLPALTDAQAEAMGAVYLKRLFMLHKQRVDALKGVLAQAPYPHPETEICTFADQKKIARAWQLAATYLVAEAQPDLPPSRMEATVNSLMVGMACEDCKEALRKRLQKAVVEWTMLPDLGYTTAILRRGLMPENAYAHRHKVSSPYSHFHNLMDPKLNFVVYSDHFELRDMQDVLQRFPTPPPTKEKEKRILRAAEAPKRQPLILVDCAESWVHTKASASTSQDRHAAYNLTKAVHADRAETSEARRHRRYTEAERELERSLRTLVSPEEHDRALHTTASLLRQLSETSEEAARQVQILLASSDLHGPALYAAKRERWIWELRQQQAKEAATRLQQAPAAPVVDRRQANLARFLESSEHRLATRPAPRLKRRSMQARRMVATDAEPMLVRRDVPLPPPGVFLDELTSRRRCRKSTAGSEASASVTTLPTASSASIMTDQHDEDSSYRAFAASCTFAALGDDDGREGPRGSVVVYHTPKRTHRSRQSICRGLEDLDLPLPDYARELLAEFSDSPSVVLPPLDLDLGFTPARPKHVSLPPPARTVREQFRVAQKELSSTPERPQTPQEEVQFPSQLSPPRASPSDARRRTQSSTPVKGHRTFLSLENASPTRFLSLRHSDRPSPRRQKLRSLFSIAESQSGSKASNIDEVSRIGGGSKTRFDGSSDINAGSRASVSTSDALPEARMSSEDVRVSSDWTLLRAASRSEMFDSTDRRLRRKPSIASRLAKRVSLQLTRG
ncbi:hypothetical protein K525DRAFT_365251 [Schizophyllum commune Loenen D]|nr:hypothetical protein K525DRAFT_365251 [Schizophyllum commune Loenen D]